MGLVVVVALSLPTPTHGVPCLVLTWIWTCAYEHASSGRPTFLEDRSLVPLLHHPFFRRANSGDHLCTGYLPLAKRSSEGVRQVPRTLRLPMRCRCAARTVRHPRYTPQDLGPALRVHARPTNRRRHSEKERRTKCRRRSSMRRQCIPSNTRPLPLSCSRPCPAASCRTSTRF